MPKRLLATPLVLAAFALTAFASPTPAAYSPEQIKAESAKANAFFERVFKEDVDRSPEFQTDLGIKKDYDKWDDDSEANHLENLALTVQHLEIGRAHV